MDIESGGRGGGGGGGGGGDPPPRIRRLHWTLAQGWRVHLAGLGREEGGGGAGIKHIKSYISGEH